MDPARARTKLVAAFEQRDWPRVQRRAEEVLLAASDDAAAHFMLGMACLRRRQEERAVVALREACRLEPARPDYLAHYAEALAAVRQLLEACAIADRAAALSPRDPGVLAVLGNVYFQANAFGSAAAAMDRAASLAPRDAHLRFGLGRALEMLGDTAGADRELQSCIEIEPRYWPAYLRLTMLKRQTAESQHIYDWRELLRQNDSDPGARIFLNLALAKESEDLGDYTTAFHHYTCGKSAARRTRPPSAERDRAMFSALLQCFPGPDVQSEQGFPSAAPIFIVGMPRTGTTLLDRMLSSHPGVCSAGETQNFPTALQKASGSQEALLSLSDLAAATRHIDWYQLGATYVESTRPGTAAGPRFIDKLPHNFLYAGFIARALPNARILCLRRGALDTCLGNFRHLFELESGFYDYSLDLLDIGHYYVEFDRLLAHWRTVLPGRIMEVGYESLVQAPEATLRHVLTFCDLPWNALCLRPEDNQTPVRTPNSWQVREPVYASSIGRWRHYAHELQPLRDILTVAGIEPENDSRAFCQ
ncbi:MAG: tetratricopeptide repeat-containing sulfotransferase family protein [Rhodanobacteraceae bacterium]